MKRKFQFYEQYGVEEYYIYDPFSGSLEGWRRRGGELKKIARMRGFVSPRLGIRFEPGKGQDNLTIFGRHGEPFLTPQEISRRRAEAERRARTLNSAPRTLNSGRSNTPPSSASWASSRIDPMYKGSAGPRPPSRLWSGGRAKGSTHPCWVLVQGHPT